MKKLSHGADPGFAGGAPELLRAARARANLSQRDLASRAGTAQSVVARIELGLTSPTWSTLERLVRAAGCEIAATVAPAVSVDASMLDDVPRILRLSPEGRLREVAQVSRFLSEARRV